MRVLLYFTLVVVLITGIVSCKHNPYITELDPTDTTDNPIDTTTVPLDTGNCSPDSVYFERDIAPILGSNCAKAGCHDAVTHEEGMNFNDYNSFVDNDIVRPGNLNNSELWEAINESDPDDIMPPPPAAPLTNAQKELIRIWILQGAKNNSCTPGAVCDTNNVAFSGTVLPILQNKCQGCHSNSLSQGGVNLTTHNGILVVASNGKLTGTVNHTPGYHAMPQGGAKMPGCEIKKIIAWVNAGAPNN